METLEQPIFPLFLDELPCSQPVSHASRQAWPGNAGAHAMTVGSGRQCSLLLEESSPLGRFSKILLESSLWTNSEEFSYVWNRLDTRFECSAFQLTPLGLSTDDNESSLWRTPNASDVTGGGQDGQKRLDAGHAMQLSDQVLSPKLWPTPCAQEDGKSPEAHLAMKARMKGGPRYTVTSLTVAAKLWPTPTVADAEGGGSFTPASAERLATGGCSNLRDTVKQKLWPTPTGNDAKASGSRNTPHSNAHGGESLTDAARGDRGKGRLWPTPRKEGYDAQGQGHGDLVYEVKARLWPTPTVQCGKNNAAPSQHNRNSDPLDVVAAKMSGQVSGSLNPRFVEELMGYQIDHTALRLSVTPSCPSKPIRSSKRSRRPEVFSA